MGAGLQLSYYRGSSLPLLGSRHASDLLKTWGCRWDFLLQTPLFWSCMINQKLCVGFGVFVCWFACFLSLIPAIFSPHPVSLPLFSPPCSEQEPW